MQIKFFFLLLFIVPSLLAQKSIVNTSHLDHLYEEVKAGDITMGIIHIYAEAPDYKWVGDQDEGIACIDDAARAAVFYIKHYQLTRSKKELDKIKNLINFNIYMQSDSGFFYNFIWKDNTINKEFRTSVAEPNWWSWRALWALSEGALFFKEKDKAYYNKIVPSLQKGVEASLRYFNKESKTVTYGGYELPAWFPYESASDQSAVIVKALLNYYKLFKDEEVKKAAIHFADGLVKMQFGDKNTPPYSAFLSWQNSWHAWGNSQSDALLEAGSLLKEPKYIDAAKKEIDNFYPFLFKSKYFSSLSFTKGNDTSVISDSARFSQIAYGIRPMVFAAMNAYEITKDSKYLDAALKAAMWFFGDNVANENMYDKTTGRGYDGIIDYDKINRNSGAESTIEALLALNRIEINKTAKNKLLNMVKNRK